MTAPQPQQSRKRKRSGFRFIFAVATTTTMIATGGFGVFPDNPLTQTFQEEISENVSADYLEPFNAYMENISAATFQPKFDSGSDLPFDPIGTFVGGSNATAEFVPALSMEEISTSIAEVSASMTVMAANTATAVATSNTATLLPTSTLLLPTWTSLPSLTASPTMVPTLTLAPIIVYPTTTKTRRPPDPATDTGVPTVTTTPPTSTATLTLTPTETPATAIPTSGSCVTGSPDTSLHGCLISNVQLDGIQQTTITVSANQTFTFQYTYQVWVAPVCPSCNLGVIAGFESTPASACDYLSNPGVYPGVTFTPAAHTFTAPGTSGSYAIFVRWLQTGACGPGNYQGFGTVIALVTVP